MLFKRRSFVLFCLLGCRLCYFCKSCYFCFFFSDSRGRLSLHFVNRAIFVFLFGQSGTPVPTFCKLCYFCFSFRAVGDACPYIENIRVCEDAISSQKSSVLGDPARPYDWFAKAGFVARKNESNGREGSEMADSWGCISLHQGETFLRGRRFEDGG